MVDQDFLRCAAGGYAVFAKHSRLQVGLGHNADMDDVGSSGDLGGRACRANAMSLGHLGFFWHAIETDDGVAL